MSEARTLLAIVLMASVTYATRALGYLVVRRLQPGPRTVAVMEAAPGCVLIAVIAPAFVSSRPADLLALVITILAACRWSMLPTVLIGVASAGVLRHVVN